MDNGFFEGIELHETGLSTGKRIRLPVRFFDWSSIMAHFPAPASNLRRLLPSDRLKPALLAPGTGILTLVAMEYKRISDVAPYNELGISEKTVKNHVGNIFSKLHVCDRTQAVLYAIRQGLVKV